MSRFVNQQIDVADVLWSEFELKVLPKEKFSCKNPNHGDSDASAIYYGEDRGSYCFGCGKAYFAIDYIMFSRDITYYEALKVAESDYGAELPQKDGEVKQDTKADVLRYEKIRGLKLKTKKQLHNYCLALKAVAEENDSAFNKYLEMKGIQ